jgi:uncharacterized protein YbaA (DUF1428 family)
MSTHESTTPGGYVDGFVIPVARNKIEEYRRVADRCADIWREHGALQYVEAVADDLEVKKLRSFTEMSGARDDETVIFAWVTFASREARDSANEKIMADPRIKEMGSATQNIFDSGRMAYGGFKTIVQR